MKARASSPSPMSVVRPPAQPRDSALPVPEAGSQAGDTTLFSLSSQAGGPSESDSVPHPSRSTSSSSTGRPATPFLSSGSLLEQLVPGLRWRILLDVWLPLPPQTKERARAVSAADADTSGGWYDILNIPRPPSLGGKAGGKAGGKPRFHTPPKTEAWTQKASTILRAHFNARGAVQPHPHHPARVDGIFYFKPPKDPLHPVFCVVKPDRDNLDKIVLDSLKRAGCLHDDAQVCAGEPIKLYAGPDQDPGVRVVLSVLDVSEAVPSHLPSCPQAFRGVR